jgi:hypothetical protein
MSVVVTALTLVLGIGVSGASPEGRWEGRRWGDRPNRYWTTTTGDATVAGMAPAISATSSSGRWEGRRDGGRRYRHRTTTTTTGNSGAAPAGNTTAGPIPATPATPTAAPAPPQPTTTTTTTTQPPANYLFHDEFNGTALDTTKWYVMHNNDNLLDVVSNCPPSPANVAVSGGNLVIRVSRNGGSYRGGVIATFDHNDWPQGQPRGYYPSHIKADFPTPYRIEMRARMIPVAASYSALWLRSVRDGGTDEVDVTENRGTHPTEIHSAQHYWVNGRDMNKQEAYGTAPPPSDIQKNFHIYTAEVTSRSTVYKVDGVTLLRAAGIANGRHHGIEIQGQLGNAGSWIADGRQPSGGDPGPWNLLVDYVRVSRI